MECLFQSCVAIEDQGLDISRLPKDAGAWDDGSHDEICCSFRVCLAVLYEKGNLIEFLMGRSLWWTGVDRRHEETIGDKPDSAKRGYGAPSYVTGPVCTVLCS
jgi:hypothetical protein